MADQQQLLDWFGGMLSHVPLPATGNVASETLRAVLLAVYRIPGERGGKSGQPCWAGQSAIASWATDWLESRGLHGRTVSERTARRALAVLERDLQLITSYRASRPDARTRATLDHYVILWSEVGSVLDRSRGVTRQSATRPTPATKPVHVEIGMAAMDWPVDRPDWPVDRPADTIPAHAEYGKEQEILSSAAPLVRSDPDGARAREADGTDGGWAAVELVLRSAGIHTAAQRADQLRDRGMDSAEALLCVRDLVRVAQANACRFRAGVGAALAYRISTGDWPCPVESDLVVAVSSAAAQAQSQATNRWKQAVDQAYRAVRARTPQGVQVDDVEVVAESVRRGVPRGWAAAERGVELGALAAVEAANTKAR